MTIRVIVGIQPLILFLQDERVDVDVISVPEPTIQISGTNDISRDYEDFKLGVRIFADVHILMTTSSSSGGKALIFIISLISAYIKFIILFIFDFENHSITYIPF